MGFVEVITSGRASVVADVAMSIVKSGQGGKNSTVLSFRLSPKVLDGISSKPNGRVRVLRGTDEDSGKLLLVSTQGGNSYKLTKENKLSRFSMKASIAGVNGGLSKVRAVNWHYFRFTPDEIGVLITIPPEWI